MRLLRIFSGFVLAGILIVAAHRPLLVAIPSLFHVNNPAPSNALVLLLGGERERMDRTIELYRQKMAPIILVCTGLENQPPTASPNDPVREYFLEHGIPAEAIVTLPGGVKSTSDECDRVRDYARTHPTTRVTVVSTAYHTGRARWIFRRKLTELGIDVRTAAAPDPRFPIADWYKNEDGLMAYFNEAIKGIFYRLRY
ncbi:YdcF family protein [Singulisphaera rosea]